MVWKKKIGNFGGEEGLTIFEFRGHGGFGIAEGKGRSNVHAAGGRAWLYSGITQ